MKTFLRWPFASLSAGVLALAAVSGFSCSRAPAPAASPAQPAAADSAAAPDPREARIAQLERDLAACRNEITVLRAKASPSGATETAPNVAALTNRVSGADLDSAVRGALANAGLKPFAAALAPRNSGRLYRDWLDGRGLTPDRRARVEALLAERDRLSRAGPFPSPEDAQARADNAAALRQEIGEDGWASLEAYEQDLPARAALTDYEDRLVQAGLPLTADQRGPMLEALRAAGQDGVANTGTFKVDLQPGESPSDALQRSLDSSVHQWDQTAEAARAILTPAQYREFDAYLGDQLSQRESMASSMGKLVESLGVIPTNGEAKIIIRGESVLPAAPAAP